MLHPCVSKSEDESCGEVCVRRKMRTPACMQEARMSAVYWVFKEGLIVGVLSVMGVVEDSCMSLRRQTPPPRFFSRIKWRLKVGEAASRRKRRMCSS